MQVHMSFFPLYCTFFRFGLAGNHPLSTLFFCWNNSSMLQKSEKARVANMVETMKSSINKDAATAAIPDAANAGQHLVP